MIKDSQLSINIISPFLISEKDQLFKKRYAFFKETIIFIIFEMVYLLSKGYDICQLHQTNKKKYLSIFNFK